MIKHFIIMIVFSIGSSAFADPSGLILKLMNTEVSMFSNGMDKLDIFVQKQMPKNWLGWAEYDWDSNQININMHKTGQANCKNENDCLAEVKNEINQVTEYWCITKEVSNIKCSEFDLISMHFTSNGFQIKNFYDGKNSTVAIKEINNFVNIKASTIKDRIKYRCTKKLTEKNIYCGADPL